MTSVLSDYPELDKFHEKVKDAYKNPDIQFSDKKFLVYNLTAKKISEVVYCRLAGDEYLPEREVFYLKLKSYLYNIYLKTIRKGDIINQVYKNLAKFLTVSVTESKRKSQTTNQTINDSQQPLLSLGDMSGGSYGAFKNRADWIKAGRKVSSQIIEGYFDYNEYEKDDKGKTKIGPDNKPIKKLGEDGKPIKLEVPNLDPNITKKLIEERGGVGAILNALQFLETDLEADLQEIRRNLMCPFDFGGGTTYKDPRTGRIKFKSWEEIEEELDPEAYQSKRKITSFRHDPTKSYVENLQAKIQILKEELKITGNRDLIQLRIHACENLIEAWETPISFPSLEDFRKEMNKIIGYEEFKQELEAYLIVSELYQQKGKVIPQQFYLLLGPPGVGKSLIAELTARALGRQYININCANENKSSIVGIAQDYAGKDFGKISKAMIEGKDRAPFVLFDEVDKFGDEAALNPVGTLFDSGKNKNDFEDIYFQFRIPMNECFFIATANYERGLPGFIRDRCTRVKIKPLTYQQRIKFTKQEIERYFSEITPEIYETIKSKLTEKFLKTFLTESYSVRGIKKNVTTFCNRLQMLTIEKGSEGKLLVDISKLPANLEEQEWNFYHERELETRQDSQGKVYYLCKTASGEIKHVFECGCFFSKNVPGWAENMGDTAT